MRDACRVRVSAAEAVALRNLLIMNRNVDLVNHSQPLQDLLKRVVEEVLTAKKPAELLDAAVKMYGNDDVEIDDDAPLSEADNGVWVGGWLWVPVD